MRKVRQGSFKLDKDVKCTDLAGCQGSVVHALLFDEAVSAGSTMYRYAAKVSIYEIILLCTFEMIVRSYGEARSA